MSVQPPEIPRLSRRTLFVAGSVGMGAMIARPVLAQSTGAERPPEIDIGRVENGEVRFPEWKGPNDAPSRPLPKPQPDEQRVGFAIVGLGRLSLEELLPAFGETMRAKVVALVSGTPEKAQAVAQQYGVSPDAIYGYDDWDRIKQDGRIQAVYVVTPNGLHRRDVLAAAGAGKHVLCEKPMARNSREARDMIAACERASVKLMIAYRCQYEPYNRRARELYRSGEHGAGRLIEASNSQDHGDPAQWRSDKALAGGGSLLDIGLYCLNTIRALTGEEPVEVFARIVTDTSDPRFREVEDNVAWTMRFPSGVMANCSSSYSAHEYKTLRYQSQKAWNRVDDAFAYTGQSMTISMREGDGAVEKTPNIPHKNQFALEIDHFAQCIQENLKPHTPGEEGLQDHRIMEAIYRSAETGRPVTLDRVEGLDVFRGPEPKEG